MDRLNKLRGDAGPSGDSVSDTLGSEAYVTANESSKYFSLSDVDSNFSISSSKEVVSEITADSTTSDPDRIISNLSPIPKKNELDGFKIGDQIEAANILSGGVNIFDDNENSYDEDELVIDDAVQEGDDNDNKVAELKSAETTELPYDKIERLVETTMDDPEAASPSKDTEVVLQIDGKNVDAIDIGNGLYLYRKDGEEELAAVQILDDDQQQPNIKFLKVRENAEGNLEVYEEIEIEIPKETPVKEGKTVKSSSHIPVKDVCSASEVVCDKVAEKISQVLPKDNSSSDVELDSNKDSQMESKTEVNLNGKMMKFSESRKSPLISTFTPMTYHSTPNKEGIPLTKTMVDLQLHPNRHSENVKKTIEVHTDNCKQRLLETPTKNIKDSYECSKNLEIIPIDKELSNDMIVKSAQSHQETNVNNDNAQIEKKTDENNVMDDSNEKVKENSLQSDKNKSLYIEDLEIKDKTKIVEVDTPSHLEKPLDQGAAESKLNIEGMIEEDAHCKGADLQDKCIANVESLKEKPDETSKIADVNDTIEIQTDNLGPKNFVNEHNECSDMKAKNINTEEKDTGEKILTSNETGNMVNKVNSNDISVAENQETNDTSIMGNIEAHINITQEPLEKSSNLTKIETLSQIGSAQTDIKSKDTEDVKQLSKSTVDALESASQCNKDSIAEKTKPCLSKPKELSSSSPGDAKVINHTEKKNLGNQPIQMFEGASADLKIKANTQNELLENVTDDSQNGNKNSSGIKQLEDQSTNLLSSCPEGDKKENEILFKQPEGPINMSNISPKQAELRSTAKLQQQENDSTFNLPKDLKIKTTTESQGNEEDTVKDLTKDVNTKAPVETRKTENKLKKKLDNLTEDKTLRTGFIDSKQSNITIVSKSASDAITIMPASIIDKNLIQKEANNKLHSTYNSLPVKKTIPAETEKKAEPKKYMPISSEKKIHTAQNVQKEVERNKSDTKKEPIKLTINPLHKSINNNKPAVPFGKWTEANRQEFLNKIKETKVPISSPNTKQLKQPNDLNRRDVLKKIDSQRQSNIASAKVQELTTVNKSKNETAMFVNKSLVIQKEKSKDNKVSPAILKSSGTMAKKQIENKNCQDINTVDKVQVIPVIPIDMSSTAQITKKDSVQRKEINNQDLIDKTIEGIINRAGTAKLGQDDIKQITEEKQKNTNSYNLVSLDEIESKMNELHGIPFVERPPHELPKIFDYDNKNITIPDTSIASKSNKIPNLVPFIPKPEQKIEQKGSHPIVIRIAEESDDEIIEHEPITGDSELNKSNVYAHIPEKDKIQPQELITTVANSESKKEPIITEKDFDKFARRTSITYEKCLTVNFDGKEQPNVIQTVVEKEIVTKKLSRNEIMLAESKAKSNKHLAMRHNNLSSKIPTLVKPVNEEDSYIKNHQSKVQIAYQSVMTAKRQQECPITIIEDKPVKVVFMDANAEFISHQLHVQGKELSPPKKSVVDWDHFTHSNSESMDSDILDAAYDSKSQDDLKFKSKHQRKQVLTPVETPELELIEPGDLDIEISPKKKRKLEENKPEKNSKTLPKKSYLLNRNITTDDIPSTPRDFPEATPKEAVNQKDVFVPHSNAISAIDNLVKAAELLETQSETNHVLPRNEQNSPIQQNNSVKRGRGRPRKYPLTESGSDKSPSPVKTPTPQKKPRLIDAKIPKHETESEDDDLSSDGELVKENWTMGKINENIVCPICNKLFRSENVVFKHVKHCTGPSPSRSDSDKRSIERLERSQELDWKSEDSKSDNMDIDDDCEINNSMEKRKSKEKSPSVDYNKTDVIVIEDTPIKKTFENREKLKDEPNKTIANTNILNKANNLVCEFCGKTFRQLSYLVNHKLQHKNIEAMKTEKDQAPKSLFSCEICKKEFRKLHHLVQHRIIHNPNQMTSRSSRKSSSDQSDGKTTKDLSKQNEDQSAGFRCEPCDKSFRKLHHLVEHRETHDEMNKKSNTATASALDTTKPTPLHNCDICKKTFKKMQHLVEHKEQHLDTSSEKSDDKSVKSSLSTKDIIHECPLCYMVFPNEHSLNKHTIICQRKKKQSAAKLTKQIEDDDVPEVLDDDDVKITEAGDEKSTVEDNTHSGAIILVEIEKDDMVPKKTETVVKEIKNTLDIEQDRNIDIHKELKPVAADPSLVKNHNPDKDNYTKKKEVFKSNTDKASVKSRKPALSSLAPIEIIKIPDTPTPKKKLTSKEKMGATLTKRQKTINVPVPAANDAKTLESSDDDEIRYMLNPDFVDESREGKLFMKVRAKKRSSLQIERPNSKDLVKRRISLQHPPKIPRLKVKPIPRKPVNTNTVAKATRAVTIQPDPVPSTDSDDSDVKYSFPVTVKRDAAKDAEKKLKKQTTGEKRKSLSNIAKRKSLGKMINTKHKVNASPAKQIKKRITEAEHRCDCGQLFSSAALLSRHTSLAHTPPRIRRRRSPPPEPLPAPARPPHKNVEKPTQGRRRSTKTDAATRSPGVATRKSSSTADAKVAGDARYASRSANVAKTRRSAPHKGVPVPEKMRKLMDKSKK